MYELVICIKDITMYSVIIDVYMLYKNKNIV